MFINAFISLISSISDNGKKYAIYGSLITLIVYVYNLISTPLFWVLIGFSIIDYILGFAAAIKKKELDWDLALEGVIKKCYIGILIILSALIDYTLNYFGIETRGIFHNFIMATLLGRELGSITKNATRAGLWMPKLIKDAQKILNDIGKETITKKKGG